MRCTYVDLEPTINDKLFGELIYEKPEDPNVVGLIHGKDVAKLFEQDSRRVWDLAIDRGKVIVLRSLKFAESMIAHYPSTFHYDIANFSGAIHLAYLVGSTRQSVNSDCRINLSHTMDFPEKDYEEISFHPVYAGGRLDSTLFVSRVEKRYCSSH